jgi:hypothetical protein
VSRRQPASRPTPGARGRDDDPVATFVRAATVGAFVGAVIAGSTVWHRIRRRIAAGTAAGGPRAALPPRDPAGTHRSDGGAGRQ